MTPGWDRRIARAALLKRKIPAAAELLEFYEKIATFQKAVPGDCVSLIPHLGPLLQIVEQHGPALLAESAARLRLNPETWQALLDGVASDPAHSFFAHVLRQPGAIHAALHSYAAVSETRGKCPFCGELPVAAVLRPEGEGGKRRLLCSLCLTEWEFRRLLCPDCGEESDNKLPVYVAKEFPHIRVEACDSCGCYIKAIDLTVDGLAVPEVDDLAAVTVDLWAAEKGYTRMCPNLLGY